MFTFSGKKRKRRGLIPKNQKRENFLVTVNIANLGGE